MIHSLKTHALHQQAGKFFFKCHAKDAEQLKSLGLLEEARIQGYFNGTDAVVMSFFVDAQRMIPAPDKNTRDDIIEDAQNAASRDMKLKPLPEGFSIELANPSDADRLARVFEANFASYPFPVFDPDYVRASMNEGVVYMMICSGDDIAAVASAETAADLRNAEMTDFATMSQYRGKGFGAILLDALEKTMSTMGIKYLYTLSRAGAASINRIFGKAGYKYTGTLVRNCHISGDFEDMNCWCKSVR